MCIFKYFRDNTAISHSTLKDFQHLSWENVYSHTPERMIKRLRSNSPFSAAKVAHYSFSSSVFSSECQHVCISANQSLVFLIAITNSTCDECPYQNVNTLSQKHWTFNSNSWIQSLPGCIQQPLLLLTCNIYIFMEVWADSLVFLFFPPNICIDNIMNLEKKISNEARVTSSISLYLFVGCLRQPIFNPNWRTMAS